MYTYTYDDYLLDQANIYMGGSDFIDRNWHIIDLEEYNSLSEEKLADYEKYLNDKNKF